MMSIRRSAVERSCRGTLTAAAPPHRRGAAHRGRARRERTRWSPGTAASRPAGSPDVRVVGSVERRQDEQGRNDHRGHGARHQPLDHGAFTAVGEEEHVDEDQHRGQEQHDPQRLGNDPFRRVETVTPCFLPCAGLGEPGVVRALLGGGRRLDRLERAEHREPPRIDRLEPAPRLHRRPLEVHHRSRVALDLAREHGTGVRRHQLGGLEELDDRQRLGLGSRTRSVVLGEREEDHEAEQQRESRREDAEHAGRPVAVVEVPALGSATSHAEDRRDHPRARSEDDERSESPPHRSLATGEPSRSAGVPPVRSDGRHPRPHRPRRSGPS